MKYTKGQTLVLHTCEWKVRSVDPSPSEPGRTVVGLVNPSDPHHGTAMFADLLDDVVVRVIEP